MTTEATILSVANVSFRNNDGETINYYKCAIADDLGNVGTFNTRTAVNAGDKVCLSVRFNSKGYPSLRLA